MGHDDSALEEVVPGSSSQPGSASYCVSLIRADQKTKKCILSKMPYFADMLESISDSVVHETCMIQKYFQNISDCTGYNNE